MRLSIYSCILFLLPAVLFSQENKMALSLDAAVAYALKNSLGIQQLELDIENERLSLMQTEAKNGLTLSVNGGYSHTGELPGTSAIPTQTNGEGVQAGLTVGIPSTEASLSGLTFFGENNFANPVSTLTFSLDQLLWNGFFLGGKWQAENEKARIGFQATLLDYEAKRNDLIIKVSESYLQVLNTQWVLNMWQDTVIKRHEELERTKTYFSFKRITEIEMQQAVLDSDIAEQNLKSSRAQTDLAKKEFSVLIGIPVDRGFEATDTPDPTLPSIDLEAVGRKAQENRYELKQVRLYLASYDIDLKLKDCESSGTLAGVGGFNWQHDWSAHPAYGASPNSGTFNLGLNFSLPVLDSGLVDAGKKSIMNRIQNYRIKGDQLKNDIGLEVERAWNDLSDADAGLKLAIRSREQLALRRELAEARFEKGLNTRIDVFDANVNYTQGEVDLIKARVTYRLALLKFNQAVGD